MDILFQSWSGVSNVRSWCPLAGEKTLPLGLRSDQVLNDSDREIISIFLDSICNSIECDKNLSRRVIEGAHETVE